MKNILVDKGAWYAYMDKDDPDHQSVSVVLESHFPFVLSLSKDEQET